MENSNRFDKIMIEKSDYDLNEYIQDHYKFQEEAVIAAINELEKRGIHNEKVLIIKEQYSKKKTDKELDTIEKDSFGIPLIIGKATRILIIILLLIIIYNFLFEQLTGIENNITLTGKVIVGVLSLIYLGLIFLFRFGVSWTRYVLTIILSFELFIAAPRRTIPLFYKTPFLGIYYIIVLSMIIYAITLMFHPKNKSYFEKKINKLKSEKNNVP